MLRITLLLMLVLLASACPVRQSKQRTAITEEDLVNDTSELSSQFVEPAFSGKGDN